MHNKVDLQIARRYQSSLNPPTDPQIIRKLHQENQKTKWFGMVREASQTLFEDRGRYATLVSDLAKTSDITSCYPKLVAFIGVTNAGKSTLVKMLIERETTGDNKISTTEFPAPVIGSAADDMLTTTDGISLYADPATYEGRSPIFWADCEGFEGGETPPLGSQCQIRTQKEQDDAYWTDTRPIRWANTEDTCKREYIVKTLYPRLLYTFSDTVVFVLRNPKTFESAVLKKLIAWGAEALETSVNQPALPHCIVVINGSDPGIDERQWDSDHATHSLLSPVSGTLNRLEEVPQFREAVAYWQRLGKRIDTVRDLILCYYGSFKVVRVPAGQQYALIDQQINKLHVAIRANCEMSHWTKHTARLLNNADELGCYLQSGFDHFITHLDIPFDFMQVSLTRNPIPQNFGGHILQLCEALSSRIPSQEPAEIQWMLQQLINVLASCVLLDCARFRKGQPNRLFHNYVSFFDHAITEYLMLHCPCSFVSQDGMRSCRSVRARHHIKGHQDQHGIISAGHYISPFDNDFAQQWMEQLRVAIEKLQMSFLSDVAKVAQSQSDEPLTEEQIAFAFHSSNLRHFHESLGPSTIRSNSTCLCCVMNDPQHPLPCGHVLCDWCVRSCGRLNGSVLRVFWCPLHREFMHWEQPKIIKYKPSEAGVRVLALDGGGIRGVVQLEILRGIEKAIGNRLPVQAFFDLMIGTGTGGLIAVALSRKGASLDRCQDMFAAICKSAYATKNAGEALMSRFVRTFGSRPQYKTSALCGALQHEFHEKPDFFGHSDQFRPEAKVAVTATDVTRHRMTLVGNYRRLSGESPDYDFERPQSPTMELRTWQAVYATMADPQHFAPMRSDKQYGGVGSNCVNPAREAYIEAQKIWPDVVHPDLLLSLGTGQDRKAILAELASVPTKRDSIADDQGFRAWLIRAHKTTKWLLRHDKDVLEAERVWRDLVASTTTETSERATRRFVRFNIDFGQEEPPPQDCESQIRRISTLARDVIQEVSMHAALRNVAYRLVATSFFFGFESRAGKSITGHICCRFEAHSDEIRGLAEFLRDRQSEDFQPFFAIRSSVNPDTILLQVGITSRMLITMIDRGSFEPLKITFTLENDTEPTSINLHLLKHDSLEATGYAISGCPRHLATVGNASRPLSFASSHTAVTERSEISSMGQPEDKVSSNIKTEVSIPKRDPSQPMSPSSRMMDLTRKIMAQKLMPNSREGTLPTNESPPPYI